MADAFTSVTHLQVAWRDLDTAEAASAEVLIVQASAIIRAKVPSIDARITAGSLDAAVPEAVVEAMVRRVIESRSMPEGVVSTSKKIEGFEQSVTYADRTPSRTTLYLEDDELAMLQQAPTNGSAPRVGTMRITPWLL